MIIKVNTIHIYFFKVHLDYESIKKQFELSKANLKKKALFTKCSQGLNLSNSQC